MATAKGSPPRFRFHLPVYLEFSTKKKIDSRGLKDVQSFLASDITLLNKNLQIVQSLRCVFVSDIQVENDDLSFGFILENREELEDFYSLSRSGMLSKTFTTYAEENSLELLTGFRLSSKPRCRIEMDEETYNKAKAFFSEGSNVDGSTSKSSNEAQTRDGRDGSQGSSDQLPSKNLSSQDRTDTNPQYVKTEVILPLRILQKHQKYESVSVEVKDLNISNQGYSTKMKTVDHNVWRADLLVPVSSLMEKVIYQFKVDIFSSAWYGIKQSYTTIESDVYQMQETDTIRQFFYAGVFPSEIVSHLKDIVTRHSEVKSIAECTIQIEKLCTRFTFNLDDASWIYTNVLEVIDKNSQKQLLLCVVVFGNLFKSYYTTANRLLTPEMSQTLLYSLTYFKSTDLSSSCTKYLFSVAHDLCRVALGNHYCFVSCISIVYPCFEEEFISGKLIELVRRKEPLVGDPLGEETYNRLLVLLEKVCQRTESGQAKELLEQLIRHIPVGQAVKVYKDLLDKASALYFRGDWQNVLYNSLLTSVKSFLMLPKVGISELKQFMESVGDIPEIVKEARPEFEKAIANCTNRANLIQQEGLKAMILRKDIFLTVQSQLQLVMCLTSLKLPSLHFLLFDILLDPKFKEASSKFEAVWFCECFDNAILYMRREEKDERKQMERVYTYLAEAHAISTMRQSEELISHIDKVGVEYLKAIGLRKLMRMAKVVEKLAETHASIGNLFKEHVQSILKHQYESNYHEMLIDLCGTCGKLLINSSVTASIVNAVINISMPKNDQVLEQFQDIVQQNDLWTVVIQATGKEVQKVKESSNYQKIVQILKEMVKKLQENELPYGYLECVTVKTSREYVMSLLTLEGKVTKTEIWRCWNQIQCCFETEVEKINSSCEVLRYIQIKMPSDTMPSNARSLVVKLNSLKRDIETGKVTASQLKNEKMIWNDLQAK